MRKTNQNIATKPFKVFVANRPVQTIYAANLADAKLFCEGRLKGIACTKIKYSKIVPL
jgi:hypothetical protein